MSARNGKSWKKGNSRTTLNTQNNPAGDVQPEQEQRGSAGCTQQSHAQVMKGLVSSHPDFDELKKHGNEEIGIWVYFKVKGQV